MRGSHHRLFASSIPGIARPVIFGVILLAIVATPAALELCAKDRKRARAAKEQKQDDNGKWVNQAKTVNG